MYDQENPNVMTAMPFRLRTKIDLFEARAPKCSLLPTRSPVLILLDPAIITLTQPHLHSHPDGQKIRVQKGSGLRTSTLPGIIL